jgi:hypothetical protein
MQTLNSNLNRILIILIISMSCASQNQPIKDQQPFLSVKQTIISPSETKTIEVIETGITKEDAITQVNINFGYPDSIGGGTIFEAKGTSINLSIMWLHNNDILIKYLDTLSIIKQDSVIFFEKDFANIYYDPQSINDTIRSMILKYERVGIMDTITAILRGQVVDFESQKPITNKGVAIVSGLVMYLDSTDFQGFYEFSMVPYGDYRMGLELDNYYEFEMDTLHLGSGDIKELNIGMLRKK